MSLRLVEPGETAPADAPKTTRCPRCGCAAEFDTMELAEFGQAVIVFCECMESSDVLFEISAEPPPERAELKGLDGGKR